MTDAAHDTASTRGSDPWALPDSPSGLGATEWRPPDLAPEAPADGWLFPARSRDEVDQAAASRVASRRQARPLRLPVPLRPLTFTDVLDGSFAVLKARPATVALLAIVVVVPVQVLNTAVQADVLAAVSPILGPLLREDDGGPDVVQATLAWASWSLALLFLGACLGRLASAWYADGDLTARQVLADVGRRWPALLGVWAVAFLAKAASLATLGLATPFVAALFVLTGPIVGMERVGAGAAMRRSFELTRRRLWPIVALLVAVGVVEVVLQLALTALPWMLADALLPDAVAAWVVAVAAIAARIVTASAAASVPVLIYLDARVRSEGLDLQLAAADVLDPVEPR